MKILFVVPVKNEESRIRSCLEAIIQSFVENVDCKIAVVDNGSFDDTVAIAREITDFVYIRPSDTVAGLRNYAANLFDCDYIVFIDADVLVSKTFLEKALGHFKDKNVAIVTGHISIPQNNTWVQRAWALNRKDAPVVRVTEWSSSMNMIVSKKVFEEIGGFLPVMETCEDIEFSLRVNKKYKIIYDHAVKVTHYGEAKDLINLFKKERWRGKSSIRLLLLHKNKFKRWVSFMQAPFFAIALVFFIYSILLKRIDCIIVAIISCLSLPLFRSLLILFRCHCFTQIFNVLVVWFVYYLARTVALFDGISGLWREHCKADN